MSLLHKLYSLPASLNLASYSNATYTVTGYTLDSSLNKVSDISKIEIYTNSGSSGGWSCSGFGSQIAPSSYSYKYFRIYDTNNNVIKTWSTANNSTTATGTATKIVFTSQSNTLETALPNVGATSTIMYKKLSYEGEKIQVDSAIRDGNGNTIASTYLRNPLTTQGDTIVAGANGAPSRVPIGLPGQVPTVNQ